MSDRYPPQHSQYTPDTQSTLALNKGEYSFKLEDQARNITRTPSPTPSEAKELGRNGVFDWRAMSNWRFWFRREWLWYYVALVIIGVLAGLMSIYHKEIVRWMEPAAQWLHDLPGGWSVPIGILFIISFPPLFGHEIVAVLCGLIWGLWIGFGIVSAGTLIGEIGNFYAFKWCLRARGEKLERENISYGCLAKVVRDGGFIIALIARLSAIPGHFTTAIFSTCGMGIIVFTLAAILSMPKQFITVYLGVILEQSESGEQDGTSKIISNVVLALTAVVTLVAMWYIYHRMNKVKVEVIHMRRKRRQGKLNRGSVAGASPYGTTNPYGSSANTFGSESTVRFESRADIPLATANVIRAPQPLTYDYVTNTTKVYDDRSEDSHGTSSVGHDMYSGKPYQQADPYGQAAYVPPSRTSTSSSRQPIVPHATYFANPSYPPPDLPVQAARTTSPPNFSRARSPPPNRTSFASSSRSSLSSPPYPNPISIVPPQQQAASSLAYDDEPLHSPFDDPKQPNPYLGSGGGRGRTSGHAKETTDASFVTAYEPSTWEPQPTYGESHHHRLETSEGPRPPGAF